MPKIPNNTKIYQELNKTIKRSYPLNRTETMNIKIVRSIISNNKKILLCKNLEGNHYFLPGGHIEHGETAEEALDRELIEEISQKPLTKKYLTKVHNSYIKDGKKFEELFFVYKVDLKDHNILCTEKHIEYHWVEIESIDYINFKPQKFITEIKKLAI